MYIWAIGSLVKPMTRHWLTSRLFLIMTFPCKVLFLAVFCILYTIVLQWRVPHQGIRLHHGWWYPVLYILEDFRHLFLDFKSNMTNFNSLSSLKNLLLPPTPYSLIQSMTSASTAAAAKSLQSCLTLCDPIDSSPPGSPVPGILQTRTLEWVAISFSKS